MGSGKDNVFHKIFILMSNLYTVGYLLKGKITSLSWNNKVYNQKTYNVIYLKVRGDLQYRVLINNVLAAYYLKCK